MTVQIQPAKPAEQFNGLVAIEADILKADPHEKIYAIVTYERVKRVEDETNDDYYPVLKVKHIEPLLGDLREKGTDLQLLAYQSRTGENELDFSAVAESDDDGDQPEADEPEPLAKKLKATK